MTNITETLSQVVSLSLLAMLPSPIFYGVIIDNTCLLWQEVTIVSKITYTIHMCLLSIVGVRGDDQLPAV